MGIIKSLPTNILKSVIQTFPLKRDFVRGNSHLKYFSLQAHPDDEILIAGTFLRIIANSEKPKFLSLTDGNRNTEEDREKELQKSFRILGYKNSVKCIMNEKEILDYVCTEQGQPTEVSKKNIEKVAKTLREKISLIEELIEKSGSDTLLTPDYAGGHFIHDITNMLLTITARRINKKRPIQIFEFPQYFITHDLTVEIPSVEIREVLKKVLEAEKQGIPIKRISTDTTIKPENLAYHIGEFVEGNGEGLTDYGTGMVNGTIHLTLPEIVKKIRAKWAHTSQKTSLARMIKYGTIFGDFSEEHLRRADLQRDFSQPPNTNALLYEIVPWRPHADFQTFRRIYEEIMEKE